MRCSQCGKQNSPQVSFCASCGNSLPLAPESQSLGRSPVSRAPSPGDADAATQIPADTPAPPAWRPAARRVYSPSFDRPLAFTRPPVVTVLAILDFIGAAIAAFGAIAFLGTAMFADDVAADTEVALWILGGFSGAIGILALAGGIGLWQLKSYGRRLQVALGWVLLVGFPIGTIIGIAALVYMYRPGVVLLFSDKPRDQLTAAETEQVAAVMGGSGTRPPIAAKR